jgi:hypothetical protein
MNSMSIARTYLAITHRRQHKLQETRIDTDALEQHLNQVSHNPAYRGVVHANRAWLAYQDGDYDSARSLANSALEFWKDNPYPFRYIVLFLFFAIAVQDENVDEARTCAQAMCTPPQMRFAPEIESALLAVLEVDPSDEERILRLGRHAVNLAKQAGYL